MAFFLKLQHDKSIRYICVAVSEPRTRMLRSRCPDIPYYLEPLDLVSQLVDYMSVSGDT